MWQICADSRALKARYNIQIGSLCFFTHITVEFNLLALINFVLPVSVRSVLKYANEAIDQKIPLKPLTPYLHSSKIHFTKNKTRFLFFCVHDNILTDHHQKKNPHRNRNRSKWDCETMCSTVMCLRSS